MNIDISLNAHGKEIKKYITECSAQLRRRTRNSYNRLFIEHVDGSFFKFSNAIVFSPPMAYSIEWRNRFAFVFSPTMGPIMFFKNDLFNLFESSMNPDYCRTIPKIVDLNISKKYSKYDDDKDLDNSIFVDTGWITFYLQCSKHVVVNDNVIIFTEHNGCFCVPMKKIKHFSSGKMHESNSLRRCSVSSKAIRS